MQLIQTIRQTLTETPIIAVFVVFWAGALASLSSCTIVRVPVVLGYISGSTNSKNKSIFLTLLFVSGLIISYTIFGILLGLMGNFTCNLIQINKYIFWTLGVVLFVFGLFVSGLIHFKALGIRFDLKNKFQSSSLLGALLFGVVFALIEMPTCPCCGGLLLLIAGTVVANNLTIYSVVIFISFALGQSFPILAIGLSTSLLKTDILNYLRPRIHQLENRVRLAAGNILMAMGIYFFVIA
ncbi:MAG: sulfite exporter TauE/SafE family protein [Sedimentisphaerales bacterium]|nr:sulfite exporter TauE/SafE family protein [Sedimentisphaerales bacterium]